MANSEIPNVSIKKRSLLEGYSSECFLYIVNDGKWCRVELFHQEEMLKRDFHLIVQIMSWLLVLILLLNVLCWNVIHMWLHVIWTDWFLSFSFCYSSYLIWLMWLINNVKRCVYKSNQALINTGMYIVLRRHSFQALFLKTHGYQTPLFILFCFVLFFF